MARKKNPTPNYLLHKRSGQARVVWTDHAGCRQEKTLPGPHDSQESRQAFALLLHELAASPLKTAGKPVKNITINEVLLAFIVHGEQHYRAPDGEPTREIEHVRTVCKHLRELYGATPATEFGPLALKTVRQKFISLGWCRKMVNQQTERLRRVFKWAAGEELIPFEVYQRLTAVGGLKKGRSEARERDPVLPVDDAVVDATLPHLNRHVRGLVQLQRLTGCRPGEACTIRRCDIDMSGPIWIYRPKQHKEQWRGKSRTISIGPRAQNLLRGFFSPNISDYLFSPAMAVSEIRAERSAKRVTPMYPSHAKHNAERKKTNPKRIATERYKRIAYLTAIARGCDRAFAAPAPLAQREDETLTQWKARLTSEQTAELKTWQRDHRWKPNQLRHTFATRVRKEHGLEAAQVLLGHSKADVTQIYAEKNEALAAAVVAKIG